MIILVTVNLNEKDLLVLKRWRDKRVSLVLRQIERYPDLVMWMAERIRNESDSDTLHGVLSQFALENISEVN